MVTLARYRTIPLFITLLGIEDLHYSLFKEPPRTGCDFHATPYVSILNNSTAVKVQENSQFLGIDGPPVDGFEVC